MSKTDDVFDILDSSRKAIKHVKRAHRIMDEIEIRYDNFYLVGGREFPDEQADFVAQETGLPYLGKIAYDDMLRSYVMKGKALIDLPSTSSAYCSIQKVMNRAGYLSLHNLLFPN